MSELAEKQDSQQMVGTEQAGSFIAAIERAALNPEIDPQKMQQLLDVQERILNKQAESAFTQALAALQAELPVITRTGEIKVRGQVQSTYAKYEDIDKALRPLLVKHGFSLSFNAEYGEQQVTIKGKLAHTDGHFQTAEICLPFDTSGNKNNVQSVGSTLSYGKRYVVGMLINLVTQGEDDDGQMADTIDEEEIANLQALIDEVGANKQKFLDYFKVSCLENIPAKDYQKAVKMLEAKRK